MKVYKVIILIGCLFFGYALWGQTKVGAPELYQNRYIGGLSENGIPAFEGLDKFKPTITVTTARSFITALKSAGRGDKILIASDINLTGHKNIEIPGGVTIYGNRGQNGALGPLIYTTSHGVHPLFKVVGDDVTFYGLRIQGADGEKLHRGVSAFTGKTERQKKENYLKYYNETMYATPVSSGIATNRNNLLVENCELSQWTYTAIYLQKGAKGATVQHCYIHHNQRFGLGYGVTVDQAEVNILGNVFDYNRHSIASTGRKGSIYVAKYNIFKEGGNETWAVDMHGDKDRGLKGNQAGEYLEVVNNTFYLIGQARAVVVRGVPFKRSIVESNEFIRLDDIDISPILQTNATGNLLQKGNVTRRRK